MRENFKIKGYFYEDSGYKCRKYLDIKRIVSDRSQPDIMVVMMNPGASRPLDGIDNNNKESEAVPDKTQDQIMKIMDAVNFDYARVLNLSDLRAPKSAELYAFLESEKSKTFAHSIFNYKRKNEFKGLWVNNVPVVFGWGVNPALINLSNLAVKTINCDNPVGIRKQGNAYYHPLPQNHEKQIEWVKEVVNQLERTYQCKQADGK